MKLNNKLKKLRLLILALFLLTLGQIAYGQSLVEIDSLGYGAYFSSVEVDLILEKLYEGEAAKEKLALTTRALGEAESVIGTQEQIITKQKSMMQLHKDMFAEKIKYYEEREDINKKEANKKLIKVGVIAFLVGMTVGIAGAL